MADREPWERSDNPEPWTRPDKAAPWLRKKSDKDQEPQETNGQSDVEPWDRPARSSSSSTVSALRNAENNAVAAKEPSYYTGNGRGSADNNNGKGNLKVKKKGYAAFLTIALFVALGIFGLGSSNSLLAPAMSALITSNTQTSFTSYTLRAKNITKNMMNGTGANAVTTGWTGKVKYSKIPNYMKKRLAKYDIEVIGNGSKTKLRWNGTDIDADQFVNMYNSNVEFRDAYTKAKRGRVATFFDNIADKIYKKLGISRNLFSTYKQTDDVAIDNTRYKDTLSGKFEGDTTNLHSYSEGKVKTGEVQDPDTGEMVPVYEDKRWPSDGNSTTGSSTDVADANTKANSMIAGIANTVGMVGSGVCTAMKVGSMIATAATAQEMYTNINYFMSQMESISKMKAGYGDASAINSLLNFMTTPATTEVPDYSTSIDFGDYGNSSGEGLPSSIGSLDTSHETGAPIEAGGMQSLMTNSIVAPSNTKNYSLERIAKSLGGAVAMGAGTAAVCAGVDMLQSVVSLAVSLTPAGLAKIAANFLTSIAVNVVVSVALSQFFSFLIPTLATVFFSNAAERVGIPAGQMLASGAASANSQEGRRGSGQSFSGKDQALAFNRSTNEVLALEAEQDRLNHSPFDITNRNTFFGSIAYSLLPTLTSTKITGIASFIRSASKSLSTIINPRVSADGEGSSYLTTFGDCPMLKEIGAVGDLYCNPIITTDMDTIDMSPDDPNLQKALMDNNNLTCDADGNCTINDNSNLAKYITFCDGRDSPPGIVDQNILGSLEEGNVVLNSLPVVGDVLGIINAGIDVANIEWANGKKCANTNDNSTFWESEGKYYQRYIEDQRILEQMGAYEGSTNPVVAYEERYEQKYLEEHPEANTYIGYLSRISGLTIENTETVLAFVTYYDFVNKYDPTNRIAMTSNTTDVKPAAEVVANINGKLIRFDNTNDNIYNPLETKTTSREYIAYFDIRNRSYTV